MMNIKLDDINKKISFWRIIGRMGYNKYLGYVLLTSVAWSLQPYFLSDRVLDLKDYDESIFLALRYAIAILFFAAFGFVYLATKKNKTLSVGNFIGRIKNDGLITIAILMGLFMFLSRIFELKAYGDNNGYVYFGMIFSILMVVFWDFKKWIFYTISKNPNNAVTCFIEARLAAKLETPIDFISWAIQSVLVLLTSLLFVYGIEKKLPDLSGSMIQSFGFAMASSFFLSLFYDFVAPIQEAASEEAKKTKDPLVDVFLSQMFASGMLLVFAVGWWVVSHTPVMTPSDPVGSFSWDFGLLGAWDILAQWSGYTYFLFIVGYVLVVTVGGYFAEHICLTLYDEKHTYGNWRIKGREWASITATFDPFLSVAFVIPALYYLKIPLGDAVPQALTWVYISSLGIFGVGLLLFMRVWAQKLEGLRTKAFATVNMHPFEPDTFVHHFTWLARVVLFKQSQLPKLQLNEDRFDDKFSKHDMEALHYILRFHGHNAFGFELPEITFKTITGGGYLFDADNQEGMLLWGKFKEDLEGKLVRIHSLRDINSMVAELGIRPEGEIGSHIRQLSCKIGALLNDDDSRKDFTFIAYKSFQVPADMPSVGDDGLATQVSYLYKVLSDEPSVDFLKAIRNIMDVQIADRAFQRSFGIKADEYGLSSSPCPLTREELAKFQFQDSSHFVEGKTIIPFKEGDEFFVNHLKEIPEHSYLIVDESVLIDLFNEGSCKLLSQFVDATRNRFVLVRSDKLVSLFFRYTTQGYVETSLSSLPCMEHDKKIIGTACVSDRSQAQEVKEQLLWSARIRSTLAPGICLLMDRAPSQDPTIDKLRYFFDVACIGMKPQIYTPENLDEFHAVIKQHPMPLVAFTSFLDSFSPGPELLDGAEEMSKYPGIDPYLIADHTIDSAKENWPFRRVMLQNQDSISKSMVSYCGLFSATNRNASDTLKESMAYLNEFVMGYEELREANTFQDRLYFLFDHIISSELGNKVMIGDVKNV